MVKIFLIIKILMQLLFHLATRIVRKWLLIGINNLFRLAARIVSLRAGIFHAIPMKATQAALKKALLTALAFSLAASPLQAAASIVSVDPCYSPLELAALFSHGKKKKASLDDRIKEKEKQLEQKERLLERLEEGGDSEYSKGISDFVDELGNSLDKDRVLGKTEEGFCDWSNTSCPPDEGNKIKDSKSKVANVLAGYMEGKKNGWDCEGKCTGDEMGTDCPCRAWQQDDPPYFNSKGKIDQGFCSEYAKEVSTCQSSLRKLKSAYKKKDILLRQREKLAADMEELYIQKEEEEITGESDKEEGSAFCLDCLQDLRDLNKPGWGEIAGNTLMAGLGVGLSVFGVRAARRAQNRSNELLALQGFPAENNFGYSLAGASLGLPFIQQGVYGLIQGNAAGGGYGCSYTGNPYAAHNPMMQHQMQAMTGNPFAFSGYGGFGNPFFGGGMAGGYGGFGNPYGGLGNPFQLQMQGNPFFGGGMAGGYGGFGNPYGGFGNPFQLQMQGNPFFGGGMAGGGYGGFGNPYFGGGMAGGMNPMMPGMNPMMPGMNPLFMNTQAQYAMQQYQGRMQLQMQIQQAYMAQQQSIQQDWMERQKVIGSLTQELYKIQSQIQMVASGGVGSFGSIGSIGSISLPGSTSIGAPQPSPSPAPSSGGGSGELPTIISR